MDALTASVTIGVQFTATDNITGHGNTVNQSSLAKAIALGTSAANAAAGGSDEVYSTILTITASSSTSLDLTSLANIFGTTITFARIKAVVIRLLASTDTDSSGTALGTAATYIVIDNTVTNALSSQSNTGWFSNAAEGAANGSKFTIPNGAFLAFSLGNAAGVVVDGTHKVIKLTNGDSSLSAKVLVTLIGGST